MRAPNVWARNANVNCITVTEPSSTRRRFDILFSGAGGALILRCIYCDHRFRVQLVGHVKSKRYCAYDTGLADTVKEWLKKKSWQSSIPSKKQRNWGTNRIRAVRREPSWMSTKSNQRKK